MSPKECFRLCDVCGMARTTNHIQGLSEDEYNDRPDVSGKWPVPSMRCNLYVVCLSMRNDGVPTEELPD